MNWYAAFNQQIHRRTRVVGSFPDGNSALMLVCTWLCHVASVIVQEYYIRMSSKNGRNNTGKGFHFVGVVPSVFTYCK